jgi:hypothetical protein
MSEKICEAMSLVADYALKKDWAPIGDRAFSVGDWDVRVNGTNKTVEGIPPFHAQAVNRRYMGMMIFNAFGGSSGGWKDTEREFIEAMKKAIEEV